MRRLHEKLRIAAKARGLRVADVARLMPEVAASAVGHWFTGKRKPQLDHLHRLAKILEVSAAALVADDPDYAQTSEERIGLLLLRDLPPVQRQAMLALMQSMKGERK